MTFHEKMQLWEVETFKQHILKMHEEDIENAFGCKYYCGTSGNTEYLINTKAIFTHLPYAKYLKK